MYVSLFIILVALVVVQRAEIIYYKGNAERNFNLLSVSRELLWDLWDKYKSVCWKKNIFKKHYEKNRF